MRRVLDEAQREHLAGVAEARRQAERDYINAIVEAHLDGATNTAIAEAVGVSADAVRQLVKRHGK